MQISLRCLINCALARPFLRELNLVFLEMKLKLLHQWTTGQNPWGEYELDQDQFRKQMFIHDQEILVTADAAPSEEEYLYDVV